MDSRNLLLSATFAYAIGILLLAASCLSHRFVDTIPPTNGTEGTLTFTFHRIQDYWNQHGRVPKTPNELPDVKDHDCSMKDGWRRELHWESDGVSKVKIWSLGSDGKPGGTGEDADIEVEFAGKQKGQSDHSTIKRSDAPQ